MVRSIEIPEPLFEADVNARWIHEEDLDEYHCVVLVGGKYAVFERTYRTEPMKSDEDQIKDQFLAEFSEKFKALIESV